MTFPEDFEQFLLSEGILDKTGLDRAIRASHATGERIDRVLTHLGLIPEPHMQKALARYYKIDIVTRSDIPLTPVHVEAISLEFMRSRGLLPLKEQEEFIHVAIIDPVDDEPVRALAYITDKKIQSSLISPQDFSQALEVLYETKAPPGLEVSDARFAHAHEMDIARLKDIANEAPVIRLVNKIISTAIEANASDIHIEPGIEGVVVRQRLDGELHIAQHLASGISAAVASRLKIMAKLDIAERRLPQDGRIKFPLSGVDIDLRVSTIPTTFGESVVLRILDRSRVELDFIKLGFTQGVIETFSSLMDQPNGIVLVTGPTGSGKTTTLYTALQRLNRPNVKIFTVEDPIEYQITRVNQVQVRPDIGLDFPKSLRAILRQDPDILMIGEMRDLETARIAIQAALTGHLVFSTLHTNSAVASITRLMDMGIEPYLLTSTINGILAQRLVRKLCLTCRAPHPHAAQGYEKIAKINPLYLPKMKGTLYHRVGCPACHDTGFLGRIAITELMIMNDAQRQLILTRASQAHIEGMARENGMCPMLQDGIEKAFAGLTTLEEVFRVTRADAS